MRKKLLLSIIFVFSCSGDPVNMDEKLFDRAGQWITNDDFSSFFYYNQKVYSGPGFILHRNGKKKEEGNIKRGFKTGVWTGWDEDGKKKFSGEYLKGVYNGKWEGWYPNGNKKYEGNYDDGLQVGLWTYYDEKGKKNLEETYFTCTEKCAESHSKPIRACPFKGQISEEKKY